MKTTYKLRRAGNSDVITIPEKIKKALDVQTGDAVTFEMKNNQIIMKKAPQKVAVTDVVSQVIDQYHDALAELVEK